jgi:hypothetical protein
LLVPPGWGVNGMDIAVNLHPALPWGGLLVLALWLHWRRKAPRVNVQVLDQPAQCKEQAKSKD